MKNKNKQVIRELSLLLTGFTYLWDRIQDSGSDITVATKDVLIAKELCKQTATIIKRFSIPVQQKALDFGNLAMHKANVEYNRSVGIVPDTTETEVNVFSLGLALFGQYYNIQNKKIHLGMLSSIVDLQDLGETNIDSGETNRAYVFSDYVFDKTMSLDVA